MNDQRPQDDRSMIQRDSPPKHHRVAHSRFDWSGGMMMGVTAIKESLPNRLPNPRIQNRDSVYLKREAPPTSAHESHRH